ncbi:MAG TPA: SGNH/GDSL hydrolase family protein [Bryobacteraceae bacterium]|nr:SGNH/GDSL hydrolase family protein [Bryobacteraceae bacterium]
MEWYEADVRELETARAQHAAPKDPVVFYGSSTIRLWDGLAEDLGDPRALNLGFGGSTLEACAFFFERLVPPVDPCSLVVYAGDNDLGDGHSAQDVLAFFRALATKVERDLNGIEFAFISVKPSPARFHIIERIRTANSLIREDIEARERGYFIDVFEAMLGRDGKPQSSLFNADGLHMSAAGYRLWAQLLSAHKNRIFTLNCSS